MHLNIFRGCPFLFTLMILLLSCQKNPETPVIEFLNLGIDSVTVNSVALRWTRTNLAFQKYEVHMSKKEGFPLSSTTLYGTIYNRDSTTASVMGLISGLPYYFKVRLIRSATDSVESNEVSATPHPLDMLFQKDIELPPDPTDSAYQE